MQIKELTGRLLARNDRWLLASSFFFFFFFFVFFIYGEKKEFTLSTFWNTRYDILGEGVYQPKKKRSLANQSPNPTCNSHGPLNQIPCGDNPSPE
ncbi:hypothetical protein BO70DRAFT_165448 [Aspergillus heteromorphus CBS 117.55]|uniref:Uncharacterized protein n=1 Tax=Aspergillus heteromorphus CBS 117.55 TaxID=1448321 RepID=A0A317WS79_9EURO|nr:uncharacterized protein BO70DRAFT_165448 [Aspergillus heteromorphus CBS 117.55]PWY89313.1 hypothetical protein BO70DRAFT_165448 [Aspergillus heteromorphus CBS 117.55]